MFEKLKDVEARYEEINRRVSDPEVISDNQLYKTLMREYKNLTPIVDKYREYAKAKDSFDEAKSLLDEGGLDKDFREIVQEQYDQGREDIEKTSEELKILLLPRDPNDDKSVIIEIRDRKSTRLNSSH